MWKPIAPPRFQKQKVWHSFSHEQQPIDGSTKPLDQSPASIEGLAFSEVKLLESYYFLTYNSARVSFVWALFTAFIGLVFLIASILFMVIYKSDNTAIIGTISGVLVEFISAIFLRLYAKSSSCLADFLSKLDLTQRFLLANHLCEELDDIAKQKVRSDVIRAIVGIDTDNE